MRPNGNEYTEVVDNKDGTSVRLTSTIENMVTQKFEDNNKKMQMIEVMKNQKSKLGDELQLISLKYDNISKMFNLYSMAILILSAFITLFDALNLLVIQFMKTYNYTNEDLTAVDFVVNIFTLIMGTALTIISSVIRFKNYREKMEKFKDIQEKLITIKGNYTKDITILQLSDDDKTIDMVQQNMKENDNVLNSVNIVSEISNKEIVRFLNYMSEFKNKITEIKTKEVVNEIEIKKKLKDEMSKK
jgi:hypothetical protein